jgi:hypothetical protein
MEPSFFTLYKRGRYFTKPSVDLEELDPAERKQEQRKRMEAERFAVAAIAFCSKHDEQFRRHFLESICEGDASLLDHETTIRVEDNHWGDLVFVNSDRSAVYVIECKINAALEDIQNPESDVFWTSGYGHDIEAAFSGANLNYIILGYRPELQLRDTGRRLGCFQKQWKDLERGFPIGSRLALDLYDSLANLGISRFRMRKTRKLQVGEDARFAGEAYALLYGAFTEIGVALDKIVLSVDYPDASSWYFGLDLKKSERVGEQKTSHGHLQKLIASTSSWLLWMGYHAGDRQDDVVLSVWFYCGNGAAEQTISDRVGKQLAELKTKIVRHTAEQRSMTKSRFRLEPRMWLS